jgi:hypothetical protein
VVDLHPIGFDQSYAEQVHNSSQVGWGTFYDDVNDDIYDHALLWSGTPESVVDLNPVGVDFSYGADVFGNTQVGSGYGPATGGVEHALLWNGTAGSVVDLHSFLGDLGQSFDYSRAEGISDNGSIVGKVTNYDFETDTFIDYAVLWTPVAEPGLQGDYNDNGVVDAADYVEWRKHNQTNFQLLNEVPDATPGQATQADYDEWRERFGNSVIGSGSFSDAIPEPANISLVFVGLSITAMFRVRRRP